MIEHDRQGAQDSGHEVRVLEFEQQAVEADREQDKRDVRIRQQVQELLERVHRKFVGRRARQRQRPGLSGDLHHASVGKGKDGVNAVRDTVDRTDRDGL